jgi:TRAP-type mannitol/chloroaromatic compound transport system substrate-binding protein
VIDAAEWIGPHYDMQIGLHKTARYYYYPGWHEPGTTLDFGFNKKAYDALPVDLRRMLDHAAAAVQGLRPHRAPGEERAGAPAAPDGVQGQGRARPVPGADPTRSQEAGGRSPPGESEKTPMTRKVHASFTKFQALVGPWDHVAEGAYHQLVAG